MRKAGGSNAPAFFLIKEIKELKKLRELMGH